IEMLMSEAYAAGGPPRDLFVFDEQTHIIRSSRTGPGNALRDIAEGNPNTFNPNNLPDELGRVNFPWNPALVGLPNLNSNFHLAQYMKDVYLDSQVTVAIMTNNNSAAIPGAGGSRPPKNVQESEANEILTAEQTMATRDWVNQLAGSTRMLGHGQLYTGTGNLWFIEMALLAAPFKNVYAEIGTTFASTVITFPTVCAHILGQLLKFMGEDRIVFGSDAVWYGSPQWQIEALWRFQIPEAMRRRYGYPELTP